MPAAAGTLRRVPPTRRPPYAVTPSLVRWALVAGVVAGGAAVVVAEEEGLGGLGGPGWGRAG